MKNVRYNKNFTDGIAVVIFCFLISVIMIVVPVYEKAVYNNSVSCMENVEATISSVDYDETGRWRKQKIQIAYTVEGKKTEVELKSDILFATGIWLGEEYSVGDKVNIFYNPVKPESIVVPLEHTNSNLVLSIGVIGLIISVMIFIFMVKNSHKFRLGTKEKNDQK